MNVRVALYGAVGLTIALMLHALGAGNHQAYAQDSFDQGGLSGGLDEGLRLLDAERYDEAIDVFSGFLRDNEGSALAHSALGRAYLGQRNYSEASKEFQEALAEDAELAEAHNGLGEVFLEQNLIAQAFQKFNEAVKLDRANPDYLLNQGLALTRVGDAKTAYEVLTKVIEMGPSETDDLAKAYEGRGHALTGLGKFERAQTDFAAAMNLDPTNKDFYYSSAMGYMAAEDYLKAAAAFTKSIEIDARAREEAEADPESLEEEPLFVEPLFQRARAFMELAKTFKKEENKKAALQRAVDDFNRALEILPNQANLLYYRGMAQRQLEFHREAVASFTQAIEFMPESSEALFRRGVAWFYLKEYDLAIADFDDALEIDYDDIRPYLWKGFTHAKQGDYRKAIAAYSSAITQDRRFAAAYNNRGLAYLQLGDHERAIDDFNAVLRIDPNSSQAFFKRGQTFLALNDNDRAITSFTSAIDRDPDHVEAYRRAAEVYDRMGNRQQAAEFRRQADQREQQLRESAEAAAQAEQSVDELPFLAPSEDQPSDLTRSLFPDAQITPTDDAMTPEDSTSSDSTVDDTGPLDLDPTEDQSESDSSDSSDSVLDDLSDDDLFGPT